MSHKCLHFLMNSNFGLVFVFLLFFAETALWLALLALLSGPSLPLVPADVVALSCRRAIAAYTRNALAARTIATSTPAVSQAAPSASNSRRLCSTHRQTRPGLCATAPAHSATAQESAFCQVQNSRSSSSADLWPWPCGGASATGTADTSDELVVAESFSAIKLSAEQVTLLYTRPGACLFFRQSERERAYPGQSPVLLPYTHHHGLTHLLLARGLQHPGASAQRPRLYVRSAVAAEKNYYH